MPASWHDARASTAWAPILVPPLIEDKVKVHRLPLGPSLKMYHYHTIVRTNSAKRAF